MSHLGNWGVVFHGPHLVRVTETTLRANVDDPRLRAIEDEVIAALGPDARWHANSNHPLRRFRRAGDGWSFDPVTRASFDQVVAARGNGLDLVIVRTAED